MITRETLRDFLSVAAETMVETYASSPTQYHWIFQQFIPDDLLTRKEQVEFVRLMLDRATETYLGEEQRVLS